ncbi:MAG: tRNA pseudouridine(38-40) synthase TruA [Firmicutes bacterium]|nr:tRNA pseudouridine(38-40) synthase TruA [Bacillota bacterium]
MAEERTALGALPGAVFSSAGRHLALVVRYDGTDYHGFQKQRGAATIQGVLEQVLEPLLGPGHVVGASRTDAGVHAAGQVVVWRGPVPIPEDRVVGVINRRLPASIQVIRGFWVPWGWDPRRQASAKQYSYRLWRVPAVPPLPWYRFVHWLPDDLSWERLETGARLFLGQHDFRAFRTEGSSAEKTVREIFDSRWVAEEGGAIWRYQVAGNGFLYRMVRHMVGAMLEAALPGGSLAVIEHGLAYPQKKVSALAPAQGLCLDWIRFREGVGDNVS